MYVEVPSKAAQALADKHLPWVSTDEIEGSMTSLKWHPENAKELAPHIQEMYHGAFRKGIEVALRDVSIVDGRLSLKLPDGTSIVIPEAFKYQEN